MVTVNSYGFMICNFNFVVLNSRPPLPSYNEQACSFREMFDTIRPCLTEAVKVVYDDFNTDCE